MATTTLYRIVARCDSYNSRFHIRRNAKVLKRDGATPVKWVYDDNFGQGYTVEEAHKALDDLAWHVSDSNNNFHVQDVSSIADIVNSLIEDEGLSNREAEQAVSWYTEPGFYSPEGVLLYAFGDESLEDDVMLYTIEECDVIM